MRNACRISQGAAHAYLDLARKLDALPEVARAFGRGDISLRHATVIASAYTSERAAEIESVETELVDFARVSTSKELGAVVRRLTDAIDGDGGGASDDAEHERRACYLSRTLNGAFTMNANGDPYNAEFIETAIDSAMVGDLEAADPRRTPQRRFDALVILVRSYLDRGEGPETHGVRPHATVVIDIDEVPGTNAATSVAVARTQRRYDGYLSAAMIELLLCDCDITRVITAGRSEVLDVGRATATTTPAQWKALVARDQHCQAPGCDRPPSRCEAHHIKHWARGGATDLDNLVLLCWQHHRQRHKHDAQSRAG